MANCMKCGAALPQNAKICDYCGSVAELPKAQPAAGAEAVLGQGAVPGSAPVPEIRFKRISISLMVVLAIVTMGLYCSIWFYVRRGQFMELSPKLKDKNKQYLFGGLLGVHIFYLLGTMSYLGTFDPDLLYGLQLCWYITLGTIIYISVYARSALAELSMSRGSRFADSTLWAVVLNAIYLQSQINRMIDARILGEQP